MKVLEKDAEERATRRKKARAEATVLKDEGNTAFKTGEYEKAVELYSQVCWHNTIWLAFTSRGKNLKCWNFLVSMLCAIAKMTENGWYYIHTSSVLFIQGLDKLKDFKELWTNRAQAYIRLGKFTEALNDCDWAQRVDENYVKAYVLQAKAHLGLLEYDKAIETYNQAKEIDKTKENMINGKIFNLIHYLVW